ncbi:hypothetical protein MATL_G00192960 [Megalops atlanticus]|uniref:Uncharacterized protein n=1 Tax=Megalops atlanticus TaxID=7932 RepID=A0A9D3T5E7_MEGAT|nr:hypothetical protein MATL_G00192960 [Megalops atlanticus]
MVSADQKITWMILRNIIATLAGGSYQVKSCMQSCAPQNLLMEPMQFLADYFEENHFIRSSSVSSHNFEPPNMAADSKVNSGDKGYLDSGFLGHRPDEKIRGSPKCQQ